MPKEVRKKFVLVSLDEDSCSPHSIRKLRRYLSSNNLNFIFSSTPDEIKEYLDKLHCTLPKSKPVAEQLFCHSDPTDDNDSSSTMKMCSNQAILEKWARETFTENSNDLSILFETSPAKPEEPMETTENDVFEDNTVINLPPLFTVHSENSEIQNDTEKKDELNDRIRCMLCERDVDVGRNRNTKIKRQAEHALKKHSKEEFVGVQLEQRYQCLHCKKMLPVWKSPCEHIGDSHGETAVEIELRDLWSKEQVSSFNSVLEECFERHLPVPRSRRIKSDSYSKSYTPSVTSKASYRIVQGKDVMRIDTVMERTHQSEKNSKEDVIVADGKPVAKSDSHPRQVEQHGAHLMNGDSSDDHSPDSDYEDK